MKKSLILFFSLLNLTAFAQKLPDVQTSGLAVPANIKIDGKYTEWNDTYAAENRRVDLFYSLANDDKNLYLLIKSANSAVASKILMGGITFTVNTQGKKREKDAYAVTYPLVSRARNQGGRPGQGQNRQGGGGGGGSFQSWNSQAPSPQRDSLALVMRKTQLAGVKEIKVSGFKEIPDSLISIYNEYGVKAVANFDQKGAFVYELAVPLNLLGISPADGKEFVYQIKINGRSMNMPFGGMSFGNGGGGGRGMEMRGDGGQNFQDLMAPTDFWGKYTLIKK